MEPTVTADKVNDLRQRFLEGKEWSREELKQVIFTMIGDRIKKVQESTPAKKSRGPKLPPPSLDDLL